MGSEELTSNYATAFVEMSEWLAVNSTNDHVHGMTYHDINGVVDNGICFNFICAEPLSYDARIVLKSKDTDTNISCYGLELKSTNSRNWPLGDSEFSLFFDGGHASFINAESELPGFGDPVISELTETKL